MRTNTRRRPQPALPYCPICASHRWVYGDQRQLRRAWAGWISWRDRTWFRMLLWRNRTLGSGLLGRAIFGSDWSGFLFRCACVLALAIAMIRELLIGG